MNVNDLVELRFGRLCKVGVQRIARVVYQEVEPLASPTLQRFADFRNESVKRANIARLKLECGCFPSHRFDFVDETFGFCLVRAISENDVYSAPRKIFRGIAAQATASAGHDGNLIHCSANRFAFHKCSFVCLVTTQAMTCFIPAASI